MTIPEKHQLQIARDTLKMSDLATWHRIVGREGDTIAYAPDATTAEAIASNPALAAENARLREALEEVLALPIAYIYDALKTNPRFRREFIFTMETVRAALAEGEE